MLGPGIGSLLLIVTTLERVVPSEFRDTITRFFQNLLNFFNPYIEVTFDEYPSSGRWTRNKAYSAIETYLGANSSADAERLKAKITHKTRSLTLSIADFEEIKDVYNGAEVTWMRIKSIPKSNVISYGASEEERRSYILSFRRRDRGVVMGSYLSYVLSEGKAIAKRNTMQRLFTNIDSGEDGCWSDVVFDHPATFDTLAMDPNKKKEIMDDLIEFTKGKDYYRRIGKSWKRGYLLYGPPGTGKSTMIAAMANFLHYNIYDIELTAVKDNTELRELMIDISKRAIIVIEDIDCTRSITGKRKTTDIIEKDNFEKDKDLMELIYQKAKEGDDSDDDDDDDKEKAGSKVTLSGLLNFIDGLWSASGGERVFIFTTNHVDRLDPALIRRGRMDKHIEMSYCCFEAFKVLANNYLEIKSHEKFDKIKCLLGETDITPADVAENLMPKSGGMCVDERLENLITALEKAKEAAAAAQQNKDAEKKKLLKNSGSEREEKHLRRMLRRVLFRKV